MIRSLAIFIALALAGCGVETAGTAATAAALKAEEARTAKQMQENLQHRLDTAMQAEQQRLKQGEVAAEGR